MDKKKRAAGETSSFFLHLVNKSMSAYAAMNVDSGQPQNLVVWKPHAQ